MGWFRKILIANRGEIAVRIQRTCREMGIATIALYTLSDQNSLHVRIADRCILLPSLEGFSDGELILQIARSEGADAIHPGYGFLAENADFIRAVRQAGIQFIGPPLENVELATQKIAALEAARVTGIPVVEFSRRCLAESAFQELTAEAGRLGFPLVVKSCRGGRGRGERLVLKASQLDRAVERAQAEAQSVYGDKRIYLEKAILPAHQINVQILGDSFGKRVYLGEREGSLLLGNQKLIEESPAPSLDAHQRLLIQEYSLRLAELFDLRSLTALEFLVDRAGQIYFTEVKPRIQVEHSITESNYRLDLVREQIRLAAGEPLGYDQVDLTPRGWSISCRITAEDPWDNFLPSPGNLREVRLPGGQDIRVDTYIYSGCEISAEYDPLIALATAWGSDRQTCLRRLEGALREFKLAGLQSNLPALQAILAHPQVQSGQYDTNLDIRSLISDQIPGKVNVSEMPEQVEIPDETLRDLAAAVSVHYLRRNLIKTSEQPARLLTGWHRSSRRLPK